MNNKKKSLIFTNVFFSEEAMAMSFDDGLNTPPPDYEEAVKSSAQWSESFSEVANSKSLIFSEI